MLKSLSLRLSQMLFGWGFVGLVYNVTDRWQGTGYVLRPGAIDLLIPFDPVGIWLYLSFFLLIPAAYFYCPQARLPWLRSGFQLSALIAGIIFMSFPTTLAYPAAPAGSLSSTLLATLASIDSPQNCFPSLHMALTVLAVGALHDSTRPTKTALLWIWGAGIAFSIIQLRRHLLVDVTAGTGLGLLSGWLCRRYFNFSQRLEEGARP